MTEDRLIKMREIVAQAKIEQEKKAREGAGETRTEAESNGAERTEVAQQLEVASGELADLEKQLTEAETLSREVEDIPAEARADFDAELQGLREETTTLRERVADLNARKSALDVASGDGQKQETETARGDKLVNREIAILEKTTRDSIKQFREGKVKINIDAVIDSLQQEMASVTADPNAILNDVDISGADRVAVMAAGGISPAQQARLLETMRGLLAETKQAKQEIEAAK